MTVAAKSVLLFVGVDGGGTGCRARIEDAERSLLGSGIAGPAALRVGVDRAFAEVEKACCAAAEDAGLGVGALASMLRIEIAQHTMRPNIDRGNNAVVRGVERTDCTGSS